MQEFLFKRAPKDVNRIAIAIIGPLAEGGTLPDDAVPQKLDFNRDSAKTARCKLEPGKTFGAVVQLYGDRGGTVECQYQPADQGSPAKDAFTAKIPSDYNGPNGALGYSYSTVIFFKVS